MKNAILLCIFSVLLVSSTAFAGDITAHGMYQGDVYTYLDNTKTLVNEIKSDHNSSFGNFTGSVDLSNEIKADYNLLFANYTAAIKTINEVKADYNTLFSAYTSLIGVFNNITASTVPELTGYSFNVVGATVVAEGDAVSTATAVTSSDAAGGSGSIVTSDDLSLTGL
jgi:hypothetical protein